MYIAWICDISESQGEAKAEVLRKHGIDSRVSRHGESFCVEIKEEDIGKASSPQLLGILSGNES